MQGKAQEPRTLRLMLRRAAHRAAIRTSALALDGVALRRPAIRSAISHIEATTTFLDCSLRCQISVCDYKTEIPPLRFGPAGDSFGF